MYDTITAVHLTASPPLTMDKNPAYEIHKNVTIHNNPAYGKVRNFPQGMADQSSQVDHDYEFVDGPKFSCSETSNNVV